MANAQKIEVGHKWSADQWDWPMEKHDGIVRVHNNPTSWEVGLAAPYFTPKEIEVKLMGDMLNIYCHHEERSDKFGTIKREVNRTYKLPQDVDLKTLKSELQPTGILVITADKKNL